MKTFIGVAKVQAEPCEMDGEPGYKVVYEPGHESWCPEYNFERTFFELEHSDKISKSDVDNFMCAWNKKTLDEKTTLVSMTLRSGFLDYETSSCVDPKNYNEAMGEQICLEHIRTRVWKLLGFVLQWAHNGLLYDKDVELAEEEASCEEENKDD